jgi:hypothetical protein
MSSKTMLVFSLAFAVLFVGPALLGFPFPLNRLMKTGDVFDLLTPIILIPLYWRLFRDSSEAPLGQGLTMAFMALTGLWVLGQGMHLSANSIGHQLESAKGTPAYQLTSFYDETLSHYLWHLGVFSLMGLIVIRAWGSAPSPVGNAWGLGAATLIYGLMVFIIVVEGQTGPIGVPLAALAVAAAAWRDRGLPRTRPAIIWIGWSHALALALFVGWWLTWGRLIEFSELGWI